MDNNLMSNKDRILMNYKKKIQTIDFQIKVLNIILLFWL